MTRFLPVALFLFCLYGCGCPELPEIYYVDIVELGSDRPDVEVLFARDLAECVMGSASRGFAYQHISVENPRLNGQPLAAEQVERNEYKYTRYLPTSQPRFGQYAVTFSIGNRDFETNNKHAELMDGRLRIHTKPMAPKE